MHAIQLRVEQHEVLLGDLREQALTPAPHDRLEEAHELLWRLTLQRLLQNLRFRGLGDAWRLEHRGDALVRLHRARDGVDQLAVLLAGGKQRLGVVAGDRDALHFFFSDCASESRKSPTRSRLASVSRFASITREAAAIDSSTASRRSARIALSFSEIGRASCR